ncbi:hypothetical protein ElyMa_004320200 [Elysia marginata]|uniref:Endonuclease/exonuclease/phosphatase domain-containing protein n=1 Tax=Elysia marginata TaxID=1093978 RepID=A0AAV4H0M5_9GAST|nr:hypothetical protein ElyMa_004320200 [Elysia marginata]
MRPLNDVAENEDKDQFYFALQGALDRIPGHDVLLLVGDFNAKIGNNNINKIKTEKTMGKNEEVMAIDEFNQAMGDIAKETLGYQEAKKTEWITPGTWRAIEDRKQIKKKMLETTSPRLK